MTMILVEILLITDGFIVTCMNLPSLYSLARWNIYILHMVWKNIEILV
jgi:hypothetical protein